LVFNTLILGLVSSDNVVCYMDINFILYFQIILAILLLLEALPVDPRRDLTTIYTILLFSYSLQACRPSIQCH